MIIMYLSGELFMLSREGYFGVFPKLHSNEGNKLQDNTRVRAQTVRHEGKYIILFLTRHNGSINDDKTIVTHRPRV